MSLYDDVSNNRAGTGWHIGGAIISFISIIAMSIIPQPFGLVVGAVGLAIGLICAIVAMKKNNEQSKKLQESIMNTNSKVNKLTPVVQTGQSKEVQSQISGQTSQKQDNTKITNNDMYTTCNKSINNHNNLSNTNSTTLTDKTKNNSL